jgi:uncharacterized protein YbcI
MSETEHLGRGRTSSAISNGVVQIMHEYTGRGPTKARTTINGDSVLIVLGDTLSKGEKTLAEKGDGAVVLDMRHSYQQAMSQELIAMVEKHVDRKVIAFMSTNHIDPDLAAEVFVLEPLPASERSGQTEEIEEIAAPE